MVAASDADHTRALINAYQKRLKVLQLQHAEHGIDARPHIVTEIEDIRARIAELGGVSDPATDDWTYDQLQLLLRSYDRQTAMLAGMVKALGGRVDGSDSRHAEHDRDIAALRTQVQVSSDQMRGLRVQMQYMLYAVSGILVLVAIFVISQVL